MHWLGREMAATHVLRSLVCLLSGLPTIAERKGKNSKHHHSVVFSEPLENMTAEDGLSLDHKKSFSVPAGFKEEIVKSFQNLITHSKRELQLLIADFSSCALVTLFLKVLCNRFLYENDQQTNSYTVNTITIDSLLREFLEKLIEKNIIEPDSYSSFSSSSSSTFYAMAGDKAGSYFLETVMAVFPFKTMIVPIVRGNLLGLVKEYCNDHFGNYVLQAVLKRLTAERHKEEEEEDDRQEKGTALSLLSEIMKEMKEMQVSSSSPQEFHELVTTKTGVFLWLLEALSASSHVEREEREEFAVVCRWIVSSWINSDRDEDEELNIDPENQSLLETTRNYLEKKFLEKNASQNQSQDPSSSSTAGSAAQSPAGVPDTGIASKIMLSRVLKLFLRSSNEKIAFFAMKAILSLPTAALEVVVNTSQINKNIIDSFLLQSNSSRTVFLKQLSMKMTSEECFPLFVSSFYGLKNIIKVFESCDIRGREKWIVLLKEKRQVLSKSKDGKYLIDLSKLDLFSENPKEWKSSMKSELKENQPNPNSSNERNLTGKKETGQNDEKNILTKESKKKRKREEEKLEEKQKKELDQEEEANDKEEEENDGDQSAEEQQKRKRKRKRPQKKGTTVA
jgi:hypothetical protein